MKLKSYQATIPTILLFLLIKPVGLLHAQIAADTTLPHPTDVQPSGHQNFTVIKGTRRGGNLFHSFSEFSVPKGGSVVFKHSPGVNNIINRVTGNSISHINGTIDTSMSGANFFLLNPNGIIFGPHANLMIRGSFLATTANTLQFADGTQFSANPSQISPLLTMSVPVGLQFGATAQPIQSQGAILGVAGTTLALLGGDLNLQGGRYFSPQGRVELGSVASYSQVGLTPVVQGWQLDYSQVQNFRDVTLSQQAVISSSPPPQRISINSDVQVQGRQVRFTNSGILVINNSSPTSVTVQITASESIEVTNQGVILAGTEGEGPAGDIVITSPRFSLINGSRIIGQTLDQGNGGNIIISSSEQVEIKGTSPSSGMSAITASTFGLGQAGNINITTPRLVVNDGGQIAVRSLLSGDGGNITINANQIDISGVDMSISEENGEIITTPSAINAESLDSGNAGSITLQTETLNVKNGAEITVSSQGTGDAGNISIKGNSLFLNQGQITAETASGEGGNINIQEQNLIVLRDQSLISTTAGTEGGGGNGGNINLSTQFLIGSGNSDITANAFTGDGGNVNINAQGVFNLEFRLNLTASNDITASSEFGQAGVVTISTPEVNPQSTVVQDPEFFDAANLVVQKCSTDGALSRGEFVITGRGGLPTAPNTTTNLNPGLEDLGKPTPTIPSTQPPQSQSLPPTAPIVEAQGWYRDAQGRVVLVSKNSAPSTPSFGVDQKNRRFLCP
jgi:filamentous hemagglutinin family protein